MYTYKHMYGTNPVSPPHFGKEITINWFVMIKVTRTVIPAWGLIMWNTVCQDHML